MPKPLPVEYVVTRPAKPSWWRLHRHEVLFVLGIAVGFWLCHGCGATAQSPHPQHTPSPTPEHRSVQPLPEPKEN
ncbi:hypothetical protein [Streptomyces boninensis]|uniref:hypothetical protein n=1 Tax=Streptomyces boninensis TaxID=2039455 RepID=UPI003B21AC06